MKKALPLLLLFSACFLFEDEDENQNTNLTLSEGAIGVTTVRLKVEPEDSLAQFTFELTRDDSTVQTLSIQSDTLIKDTGLNPNTSYTYTGYWMDGIKRIGESNTLTLTTMDTTSHNFVWEFSSFAGEFGLANWVADIHIVDENDIWIVGSFTLTDSSTYNPQNHQPNYNMGHWNGQKWEMTNIFDAIPLLSIEYFSEDDIWVTPTYPAHWDGENWTIHLLHQQGIVASCENSWGTSSSNIYFIGLEGSIVHYNGSDFTKMESGTDVRFRQITGSPDGEHIYIIGHTEMPGDRETMILEYNDGIWEPFYYTPGGEPHSIREPEGIYIYGDTLYITHVDGIWKHNYITKEDSFDTTLAHLFYEKWGKQIIVQNLNDIVIRRTGNRLSLFNGLNWTIDNAMRDYFGIQNGRHMQYKDKILGLTGSSIGKGLVGIGIRQ